MQPSHAPQASSPNAVNNNKKLFSVFAKKLAQDDPNVFKDYTDRFANWLSDDRAYYTEARPEILKVLTTAYWTVRRNAAPGLDPNAPFHVSSNFAHPMVDPYNRLLQQVFQHMGRFTEPTLKETLRTLLATVLRNPLPPPPPAYIDLTEEPPTMSSNVGSTTSQLAQPLTIDTSPPPPYKSNQSSPVTHIDPKTLQPPMVSQPPTISTAHTYAQHSPLTRKPGQTLPNPVPGVQQPGLAYAHVSANPSHTPPIQSSSGVQSAPAKLPHSVLQAARQALGPRPVTNSGAIFIGHNGQASHLPATASYGMMSQSPDVSLSSPFSAQVLTPPGTSQAPASAPAPRPPIPQIQQGASEAARLIRNSAPASVAAGMSGAQQKLPTLMQTSQTPPIGLHNIRTQHTASPIAASPVSVLSTQMQLPSSRPSSSASIARPPSASFKAPAPPTPTPTTSLPSGILASSPTSALTSASSSPNPLPNRSASMSILSPSSPTPSSTTSAGHAARKAKRKPRMQLDQLIATDLKSFTSHVPPGGVKAEPVDDAHLLQPQSAGPLVEGPIKFPAKDLLPEAPTSVSTPLTNSIAANEAPREYIVISDDEDVPTAPRPKATTPTVVAQQEPAQAPKPVPLAGADTDQEMEPRNELEFPEQIEPASSELAPLLMEDSEMKDDIVLAGPMNVDTSRDSNVMDIDSTAGHSGEVNLDKTLSEAPEDVVMGEEQPEGRIGPVETNVAEVDKPKPADMARECTVEPEPARRLNEIVSESTQLSAGVSPVAEPTTVDKALQDTELDGHSESSVLPQTTTSPPSSIPEESAILRPLENGLGLPASRTGAQAPLKTVQLALGSSPASIRVSMPPEAPSSVPVNETIVRRPDEFGHEAHVAAEVPGQSKKCTIRMRIAVVAENFDHVILWRDRKLHTKPLENSYSYTLWCYPTRDSRINDPRPSLDIHPPSAWPTNGHLCMRGMLKGTKLTLPMSPPYRVGPYGMIDVTDFIDSTDSTIELTQTTDTTAYHFVLRCHHPLQCQLDEALEKRRKDELWRKWTSDIIKPFDIPLPSMIVAAT